MHPKTRKLLYSLRLRKVFSGVFVKANEGVMEILQKLEPYVTYGYVKPTHSVACCCFFIIYIHICCSEFTIVASFA